MVWFGVSPIGTTQVMTFYQQAIDTSLFDKRFRKAFSPPYSSPLRLIQAHSSQALLKTRTLAGIGWNELE
jgi:hypothetical protein